MKAQLNILKLVYPPVNADLSEIAIKLSVIFKSVIDGFMARNNESDLEGDIDRISLLLDNTLKGLIEINEKAQKGKERIIHYSAIISSLKGIIIGTKDIYAII
ncbi:MAG: hypothetical protein ACYDDB_01375 [bacterium]